MAFSLAAVRERTNDMSASFSAGFIFMHNPCANANIVSWSVKLECEERVHSAQWQWSVRGNLTESTRSLNERPFLRTHHL